MNKRTNGFNTMKQITNVAAIDPALVGVVFDHFARAVL